MWSERTSLEHLPKTAGVQLGPPVPNCPAAQLHWSKILLPGPQFPSRTPKLITHHHWGVALLRNYRFSQLWELRR